MGLNFAMTQHMKTQISASFSLFLKCLLAVTFFSPPVTFASGPGRPPVPPLAVTVESDSSVPAVKSITTRAVDVTHSSNDVLELQLSQIIDSEVTQVTVLKPDDESAVPSEYYARTAEISEKFESSTKNFVTVSATRFADWFEKRKVRIGIIAFEVTLMSGLKFTELYITSQPTELAPALTASILIGSIIGYVEWHTPYLVSLYRNHNSFVKNLIARLNEQARHKLAKSVDKFWWFTKNATLNTFLYSQFKIILYASMKADGTILERVVNGAQMITPYDAAMFGILGFGATGAGMPTSELIAQYSDRLKKEAGDDPVKLRRADDILTFWWSTALTVRAASFTSLLVGYTFDWPNLMAGAVASIVAVSGGSWWAKRRIERRQQAAAACDAALKSTRE